MKYLRVRGTRVGRLVAALVTLSVVTIGPASASAQELVMAKSMATYYGEAQLAEKEGDLSSARAIYSEMIEAYPEEWRALVLRGQVAFRMGDNSDALADFDRAVELSPEVEPELWQRGIAQYYAGKFVDCTAQFEKHRSVNPNDVENAVWHFLCLAKTQDFDAARERLLPVGADARAPMKEIYRLFEGNASVDEVIEASSREVALHLKELAVFYGQFYVGLYLEAAGEDKKAKPFLAQAAASTVPGYMIDVARLHEKLRPAAKP